MSRILHECNAFRAAEKTDFVFFFFQLELFYLGRRARECDSFSNTHMQRENVLCLFVCLDKCC